MKIGDRISARGLTDILDSSGVKSKFADDELPKLKQNLTEYGWRIDHVAYKPRSRFQVRGEPVFQFVLTHPNSQNHYLFEVPYGPQVRNFVLENCIHVYYIRNVSFWEKRGTPRERLLVEDPSY